MKCKDIVFIANKQIYPFRMDSFHILSYFCKMVTGGLNA